MATPDYIEQVVISRRSQRRSRPIAREGVSTVSRPSVVSLVWVALDCMSVLISGLIAFRIRLPQAHTEDGTLIHQIAGPAPQVLFLYLLLFCFYLVVFARIYGLYRSTDSRSGMHEQRMTVQATLTAGLLLCGTLYLLRAYAVSRVVMIVTVLLTMVMLMARRALWRKLRQKRFIEGLEVRNVLIVGDGRVGHALRNHLESLPHMGFRFKGFITMDGRSEGIAGSHVVGNIRNCVALARSLFVDEIYFSTPADKQTVIAVVEDARSLGIEVRVVPDLYDGLAWNAPVEYIGQFPTIPLHRQDFPRDAFLLKRVIDILLASAGMVLAAPFMAVIALLIRWDSPGPVLYTADRLGRKGRVFKCCKFRTMVKDADQRRGDLQHMNERDGVLFKIKEDPRLTGIGRWLRKYSLDELPQLWNVLKGEMSMVGPRPPLASEVEKYDLAHLRRLDVLPGITGLWQVEARQDPSFDNYISLDTAYVENWSLLLDMRIMARTIGVVVAGTGV